MAVSVSPKAGVGGKLRRARREQGLTLEEIALKTRIHPRYLRALEHDAPPTYFRAPIYARAFLREYATCIGLDPEPLVDAYRTTFSIPEPLRLVPALPRKRRRKPRLRRAGAVVAAIAVVAGAGVLGSRFPVEVEVPRVREAVAGPSDAPATAGGGGVEFRGVVLQIRVRYASADLRVVRRGEVLFEGTREEGWRRTFRADRRLEVATSNAGAVVFTLNGERVGALGDAGDRARGSFVWERDRARLDGKR